MKLHIGIDIFVQMKNPQSLLAIVSILAIGLFFHLEGLNDFPSFTHAWAQSDRFALALGFVNNGLNFFSPETFVFNKQFPDGWSSAFDESIVAVDFPIHDYIPAIFMKLSGVTDPWIFRLYILLYSMAGLFFLFKLTFYVTTNSYKSWFVTIFAATSPVFVYYQAGFLPSIPSLSNAIIGTYFYVKYLKTNENSHFSIAIAFICFAALARTTFLIPYLAVWGLELLRYFIIRTSIKSKIPIFLISAGLLFGFAYHNANLRDQYGSIFLAELMPAKSVEEIIQVGKIIVERWIFQYFSLGHYLVFFAIGLIGLWILITQKIKINQSVRSLFWLSLIIFLGCLIFLILMLYQFPSHDYYFLDTFFLPVLLLLILSISLIPDKYSKHSAHAVAGVVIGFIFIHHASNLQQQRKSTGHWDTIAATTRNFTNSSVYLSELDISNDSKILVFGAYAPNIPFILMNRKGYAVMAADRKIIQKALSWDFDFVIIQNEFFLPDIYSVYPEILSQISKKWDNGRISICQRNYTDTVQTITQFLGLENQTPLLEEFFDYESAQKPGWENIKSTTEKIYSGNHSGKITEDMEYGLTFKTSNLTAIENRHSFLLLEAFLLQEVPGNVEMIASISANGENVFYKSYHLGNFLNQQNTWENVNLVFSFPPVKSSDYEFAVYVLNSGKKSFYIDDFKFSMY